MSSRLVLFVALFGFLGLSHAAPSPAEGQWKLFKAEHSKVYSSESEERLRMNIFSDNFEQVRKHNQLYEAGETSFEMGINQFSDMLLSEVASAMNGFRTGSEPLGPLEPLGPTATFGGPNSVAELPKTVDWRTKGLVTPVKNQGDCGSCYAFSATGSLEGQHAKKTGKLVSFSEQQIIDCSRNINHACDGGRITYAFLYIIQNGGIDTEEGYPYCGHTDGFCNYNATLVSATERGFVTLKSGSEQELMQAVATIGPISVAIDAYHQSFLSYKSGIYYEPTCHSDKIDVDHALLVVGYGTEKGKDYWLVKNSWAKTWGDEGYIKMSRNRNNNCGIATMPSYPIV